MKNQFLRPSSCLLRLSFLLPFIFGAFSAQAQEYLYGLTKSGGYYNMGVPYQIATTGQGFLGYGSFDGNNGGNAGNGAGFIQIAYQNQLLTTLSAMTMAGDQNLDHGMRVDIKPGQGGFIQSFNFLLSADGTGFNPGGKFLLASDDLLYGLTSTEGQFDGGSLFSKSPVAGPNPVARISFDGVNKGRSPKGSLIQGPDGLLFGMTAFGGSNDLGVIFSYNVVTRQFIKIYDFDGAATGANPTGSLVLASDGKLYGMTSAGGTSNHGVVFRINTDGSAFTKLKDLDMASGTTPLGSLIQHADGILYGMTSAGGSNDFGTIFSLTTSGTFDKLVDFNGTNGKSPVGDLVSSLDGQAMYGVTHSGGVNDKGVFFRLENDSQFTPLYDFAQSTGSHPVGSLVMVKKYPEMTFSDMPKKTTTSTMFTPDVQASSDMPVYLMSSNPDVAVIENNQIKIVGSGGVSITAYVVGNHEYLGRSITKPLHIELSDQTIDFPPIPARTYGDAPFTLSATSSSGLPVHVTAFHNDVVSSDGTNWYIKNAGTITVRAVQEGNSIYKSTEATQELVVNQADQTITFSSPGDKTCCQSFSLNATASSGLDVEFKTPDWTKLSIIGDIGTIHGLGSVQIIAYNNGNKNYKPIEKSQTINLLKGTQSIFFSLPANTIRRLDQGDMYVSAGSTSGLPVTYTSDPPGIAVLDGSVLRIIGVGTTTITATQNGNDLMDAALSVSRLVTVEPPLSPGTGNTILFDNLLTRYVNDPPFNLSAKATSGLPVSYQSSNPAVAEVTGNLIIIKDVGSTTITARQPGNDTISAAVPVQRSLNVVKRTQYINLGYSSHYYSFGIPPFPVPSRSSGNLPLSYNTSNASVAYVDENYFLHIVGSGNVWITASQAGNAEYSAADNASSEINISSLYQTIKFVELPPKTFGEGPFTLSATASSGLAVEFSSSNAQVATIDGSTVTITGAGTTTIKAKQNGYPGYRSTEVTQQLIVNKATQTVTFAPLPEKNFNENPFTLSASSSVDLPISFSSVNPAIAKVDGSKIIILGAGTVEIVASQPGNENYLPAEARQELKINGGTKTFDLIGATSLGGLNNSGVVFTMKTDGSDFSSLKSFSPRTLPFPPGGFIKGSDSRLYGNFRTGGARNAGAIVRLEPDGSDMTIIYSYNSQTGGSPQGNILQASDGDLYGMTRSSPSGGGTIFKVRTDGSGYTTLRELNTLDGIHTLGGLTEAPNGKLYGMTLNSGFFGYGTIFSIAKDGTEFNVIFRFNDSNPVKSGYNPRGDLVPGPDGYLYGTLSSGGDNGKGVLFKINPDGSDFTKIVVFDGALKGATPGASLLIGSDGRIYGITQAGGASNQGSLYAVDNDGLNFIRLFDFDGANTGGNSLCKLTEGSDGLLYGMTNTGGTNALGTVFKIAKDGTGFQKLADLTSSAARPVFGPLVETQPGKFFGMTANGGAGDGGTIFSITSAGIFSIIKDFPEEEANPNKLIADNTGEFYYGLTYSGKHSIFRITTSGHYERIFEIPSGVLVTQLYYISTGHLWCNGIKDGLSYAFRVKTDGTEFEPLPIINTNIPSSRSVEWLTERSDGTIFGITTRGTVANPGMIFTIQNNGTGFSSKGFMPIDVEFHGSNYLQTSDGEIFAVSSYTHTLYRYDSQASSPMQQIVVLPLDIGQVPRKLIELNGGRIGVAMRGGQIFSIEKDGTQFITILQQMSELGSSPADMIQTYDGWLYVSASMGGAYDQGAIYKMLANGASYTAIRSFNGEDGDTPNNIFFKKLHQTFTFDPIAPKKVSDPAFTPVTTSSSGARILLVSSNPAVAIIEDGKIKPVSAGTTIVTASIPTNANYYAADGIQRELVVDKGIQTISFTNPGDQVFGNAPFELLATSDAELDVSFQPLSANITISGKVVTITGSGVARIKATQNGNHAYDAAAPVEVSFCVNPPKPIIGISSDTQTTVLTSSNSSGNQWYRNNEVIAGATETGFNPDESGIYTVVTTTEGCFSLASDPYELVISGTGNDPEFMVIVFPNPVKDAIYVHLKGHEPGNVKVELLDTFGRIVDMQMGDSQVILDAANRNKGLYIVKVIFGKHIVTQKVLKE